LNKYPTSAILGDLLLENLAGVWICADSMGSFWNIVCAFSALSCIFHEAKASQSHAAMPGVFYIAFMISASSWRSAAFSCHSRAKSQKMIESVKGYDPDISAYYGQYCRIVTIQ